jgi:malonate-semialdehyde dehydrogenase (acetylating)/methylmalonate-semialdehyde dehydrogenase
MTTTLPAATRYPDALNCIGGALVRGHGPLCEVHDPGDGSLIAHVSFASADDVDAAVRAARAALPGWAGTPIKERVQVLFRYRALLEQNLDDLAQLIVEEHGKVLGEAQAEVLKSMETTEFACALPQIAAGQVLEVSRGVECRVERQPVGVVASIAPFNFPNMIPNWTIPNALVLGNVMVLKPSDIVPLSAMRIAALLAEAGLPPGVLNIVHGGQEVVEAICDHPDIAAVTFVGSTRVAKLVYRRGTAALKRVLALGGAKNHVIVLPDAEPELASTNIVASVTGCTGQRCMAASVMVAVGSSDHIIKRLVEQARSIIPGRNLGPVISREAKERIERYITEAERDGAKVLLDGRGVVVPGREGGYYVGPTVLDQVRPEMRIAQEEVFGPVLVIIRASTVDEAIAVENRSPYGNAASVYTESGGLARHVTERASAGMVGINVGVPVPREPFSFGGWNDSKFGVGDITGPGSIEFWTRSKKTTTKWNKESGANWMA